MGNQKREFGFFPLGSRRSAIAETLRHELALGKYAVNERFPSEQMLVRRFKVARATVSSALAELKREGLLRVKIGSGAYVTSRAGGKGAIGLLVAKGGRGDAFEPIARAIEEEAGKLGYETVSQEESEGSADVCAMALEFARQCAERHVVGVIMEPFGHAPGREGATEEVVKALREMDIPVVLVDREVPVSRDRCACDIVGFDGLAHVRRPGIAQATGRRPCEELGKVAVHALVERIRHRELPPREILLATEFMCRDMA